MNRVGKVKHWAYSQPKASMEGGLQEEYNESAMYDEQLTCFELTDVIWEAKDYLSISVSQTAYCSQRICENGVVQIFGAFAGHVF